MKRPHVGEFIRRHPKSSAAVLGTVGLLGSLELVGYLDNPTQSVPVGSCLSSFSSVGSFHDPKGAGWKYWSDVSEGVSMTVDVPKGAEGVVAGFESPGAGPNGWSKSEMIPSGAGQLVLKFGIGRDPVDFGAAIVSKDPRQCQTPPHIHSQYFGARYFVDAPGQLPWPNPVNIVVNLLP